MMPLINTSSPHASILNQLKHGAIVVTPNNRLSRELLTQFAFQHPDACIEKPRVYAFNELLQALFAQAQFECPHVDHPTLLSTIHLRTLWRQVLSETGSPPPTEGLLQSLIKAWGLCHEWQVNLLDESFQYSTQHVQFLEWVHHIEHQLTTRHAISEFHLCSYLQQHLPNLSLPQTWLWFCFDDIPPVQSLFQTQLTSLGYTVESADLTPCDSRAHQLSVDAIHEEFLELNHWIQSHPNERLGIIVPTLNEEAQSLTRLMHYTFDQNHVNISYSQPLSAYPLAAHAITWLTLDLLSVTSHQRQLLLTSIYLEGSKKERHQRAQWMQKVSLFVEENLHWVYFLEQLPASTLKTNLQNLTPYPEKATLFEWLSHFESRLKQLGFPGDIELDSTSYQCLQRLIKLFDEFRTLELLTDVFTPQEALETLQELANISTFQPERPQSSIHILGLLEASGCLFDHLWVMHATDQNFPQQGQCSAFIPISIQKKLNMPHATHAREMRYARQIFQRLSAGSRSQVFSYARFNKESTTLPSPLIKALPHLTPNIAAVQTPHLREPWEENYHLPLLSHERLGGGTTLLANQAKCAFRAFAAHRLHLQQNPEISLGLNPKERGQMIHVVLEKLWGELQSQQQLFELSNHELYQRIDKIMTSTLKPFFKLHDASFPSLLQTLEKERLTELVLACLNFEKSRPNFEIEALEHSAEITLAGLSFRVKLDRMDRLDSGEKWVIDYKSRLPTQKPWNEARPEEPQLLLYALLDESIHGMMFIELRHGKIQYQGFADSTTLTGIQQLKENEDWHTHQARWRAQLTQLAEEFKTGHCYPTPVRNALCQTCEFKPICRVT